MLENFSDYDLLKWYESDLKKRIKKSGLASVPALHGYQTLSLHDSWNLYDYGDILKIVYFKTPRKIADPRKAERKKPEITKAQHSESERFASSITRSKARVFELAMCNEFKYFCTFTQDEKKRDRFNLADFRKDFAMLVRNLNRSRAEKIKYLLIPEQHKDSAWHMHGLLLGLQPDDLREFRLDENLPARLRDKIKSGVKIYDWTRYRRAFGYFSCTEIADSVACSKYITKYISKDLQKTVREQGEHLFFASQGLKGRECVVKYSFDRCPIDEWDFENDYIKIKEIRKTTAEN